MKQQTLNLFRGKHGGRRPNSGRKRMHSKGVAHRPREKVTPDTPVHINFKYSAFIQTTHVLKNFEIACYNALNFEFEVCYFSIQANHIHLIAEARDTDAVISGMRSITNTLVKRIGKGSIQLERYHLHVLKNPTETKNAIQYVLDNDVIHTEKKKHIFSGSFSPGESWLLLKAEALLFH